MNSYLISLTSIILKFTTLYQKKIICKILDRNEYLDEPKRFFYTIMHKTNSVIDSINISLRNFDTHFHLQNSMYILLRSVLADIIVSEYVIIKGKNNAEKEKIIEEIYTDHIQKTFNSISGIYAKVNDWSTSEIEKNKKNFIEKNSQFFDNKGELLIKRSKTSPESLIKIIYCEKPKSASYDLLKLAFHYYDIFSKYEHLGEMSFFLTHRVYDSQLTKNKLIEITESLNIAFSVLINYLNCWDDQFEIEKKELLQLHKEFNKINSAYMQN